MQVVTVENSRRETTSITHGRGFCRRMLVGYARVSTAEQNPDHQTDALLRAGVARDDVHVDHASGARHPARSWTWSCGSCGTGMCWW